MLWAGWLAFNGAAAYRANLVAAHAVFNTNVSGAAGFLTWLFLEVFFGTLQMQISGEINNSYSEAVPDVVDISTEEEASAERERISAENEGFKRLVVESSSRNSVPSEEREALVSTEKKIRRRNRSSDRSSKKTAILRFTRKSAAQPTGALIGLIAITTSAGFVTAGEAAEIGILSTCVIYLITCVFMKIRCRLCLECDRALRYDYLNVFIFHGMAGFFGTIFCGFFYQESDFPDFMWVQLFSSLTALLLGIFFTLLCLIVTSLIFYIINFLSKSQRNCLSRWHCDYFQKTADTALFCQNFTYFDQFFETLRYPINYSVERKNISEMTGVLSLDGQFYNLYAYNILGQNFSGYPDEESQSLSNKSSRK